MVFMQPGAKVNGAYYCDVLLLKQFLSDICQTADDFCKTLDFTPWTWPPNRPDLSTVDCRLLSHSGMRLSETTEDVKHR